jgi:hypothetical protein
MPRKKVRPPKKIVRWRQNYNSLLRLSKDEKFMAAVRKWGYLRGHMESVIDACETFGLDPEDGRELNICLGFLAHILFQRPSALSLPMPGKRGKPVQWTEEKKRLFRFDCMTAMRIEPSTTKVSAIARRLQNPKNAHLFDIDHSKFKRSTLTNHLRAIARIQKSKR